MSQIKNSNTATDLSELVAKATGPLEFGLTNDYMFRALLQKNQKVLKGLICSALHKKPEEIRSVEIKNPIILGNSINEKNFVLDVHVLFNNNTLIDLEMQVLKYENWPDRSLGYLCRTFDNLNKGDDYINSKTAIQIGFLDFTLFPESPEFHSTYKLMNVKNQTFYSDKFILSMVDLNHIELATAEDKEYQLDHWAALFKATTWEDIKMIAKNNTDLQEACETLLQLSADDNIREQCDARRAYYARERHHKQVEQELADARAAYDARERHHKQVEQELTYTQQELSDTQQKLSTLEAEIAELKALLAAQKNY